MIIRKSRKDIERMRRSGELLHATHEHIAPHVQPGATTGQLDELAENFIRSHGGFPTFKGYRGFPGSLCTSPNEMVVHGIPGDFTLTEGDLISVDCGVTLHGWVADAARSYVVGGAGANPVAQQLIDTAYASLDAGIAQAIVGNTTGDVGHAVQQVVEAAGFGVIRTLVGHGVGRNMHEEPQVPNFGHPGDGPRLEPGYVFAIEPMITVGSHEIVEDEHDGWSIYTRDGSLAAHVEHTIAVMDDGPVILTAP